MNSGCSQYTLLLAFIGTNLTEALISFMHFNKKQQQQKPVTDWVQKQMRIQLSSIKSDIKELDINSCVIKY